MGSSPGQLSKRATLPHHARLHHVGPHPLEPQEVILCMHMEKTAGTVARSWFEQHGWQKTSYCVDILGVQRELIKLLRANHKRIFVEHHCALDW
jgi:hypothetical protein